jgi:hypothetical protein
MAEKSSKGAARPRFWRSLRSVGDPNATRVGLEKTETCLRPITRDSGSELLVVGKNVRKPESSEYQIVYFPT